MIRGSRWRLLSWIGLNFGIYDSDNRTLVFFCLFASFLNQADRINIRYRFTQPSVAILSMAEQYGWERFTKGWILSGFAIGYLSTQILGGYLSRKFGTVLCMTIRRQGYPGAGCRLLVSPDILDANGSLGRIWLAYGHSHSAGCK